MIASGGVGTLADLEPWRGRSAAPNIEGAIVGRALYERRFTVAEGRPLRRRLLGRRQRASLRLPWS